MPPCEGRAPSPWPPGLPADSTQEGAGAAEYPPCGWSPAESGQCTGLRVHSARGPARRWAAGSRLRRESEPASAAPIAGGPVPSLDEHVRRKEPGRRGATWHTAAPRSRGFVMRPGPHQPGDPGPCRGLQAAPGGVVPGTRAARAGPLLQALGVGSRGRDWPARSCGPILRSRHTAALPPSEAASRHSTAFVRRLRSRETASQRRSQKPSPPSTRPHTLHDTAPAASGPHARRACPAGRASVAGGGTLPSHREQVPPAGDPPAPSHTLTATEPAWPCQHAAAGGPFSWDSSGL